MFAGATTKKAKIKALNGAEIEYRELTMNEIDEFNEKLIKEYDSDGKPVFDYNQANEIKYVKVAAALIKPEMTIDDLKELSSKALPAITEINALIDGTDTEEVDDEGNEPSPKKKK